MKPNIKPKVSSSPSSVDAALPPGAPRRTQIERRTQAEARLLAAARDIVARKGWVGMTLAEVGEAAGYSRGLAAHHFGSKPKLLRALASHINENFMRELEGGAPTQDGLDALLGFVETYLGRSDALWTNTRALLLLMAEAITDNSETGEDLALYNQSVLGFLAQHWADEPCEYSTSTSPLRWDLTREHFPIGPDGRIAVPDESGLGVSLNLETVAKYRLG